MLDAYQRSAEADEDHDVNTLWILAYFSRIPVKDAEPLLRSEISTGKDASRRTLAAVGLGRVGIDDAEKSIEANVFEAYDWVKDRAKEYLIERLQSEKSGPSRRRLEGMMTKLARK